MPDEDNKILKYVSGEKSLKVPFVIYADLGGGAAHNLRYKIPKEIPVVFHNGSTYDYHFIIKQLAREFKGTFECLGENTKKYITFSAPIIKEHDNGKTTVYKLKFIDSCRFMQSSLSNLLDNLSEINNKKPNKFMNIMRSMTNSLSQSIGKLSKIDEKISQNEFIVKRTYV